MQDINVNSESLSSVINNPFQKTKIKRIYVSYSQNIFSSDDKWSASGSVEFENGNTKGEQGFSGNTFDDVVLQIKSLIESLKENK